MSRRESRLKEEFRRMQNLLRRGGLIDFRCADLSTEEASAFLAPSMSWNFVFENLKGFTTPKDFQLKFPGKAPEKYLIIFNCKGLWKVGDNEPVEVSNHAMEVVYGTDYPSKPPRFVWLTPNWHPNILLPYLCTNERPFAISITLDQICLMVGRMIQYWNYNIADPLNKEAAAWATKNKHLFPVDTRDLLTGQEHSRPLISIVEDDLVEWVEKKTVQTKKEFNSNNPVVEII